MYASLFVSYDTKSSVFEYGGLENNIGMHYLAPMIPATYVWRGALFSYSAIDIGPFRRSPLKRRYVANRVFTNQADIGFTKRENQRGVAPTT